MKPVRIAIADDDADMRNVVRKIIERDGGYELVGEAENGAELVELFDREHPQALILDVEMPVMTGIECARAIQDRDPGTVIIFSTAHDQYMQDAFELYAFDYLLKPFKLERALKTLELVRERLAEREKAVERTIAEGPARAAAGRIMLRHKEGVSLISVENIILVQREERMTVIYTSDGNRYMTGDSLAEIDEKLPDSAFIRTHKSYIVNINFIDSITPYGRWTYVVKLHGTTQDALITHEKFEELQKLFE
ncbi:MAG: response regulator transcription factor [Clostridia bacterium]|nr:response regulator transcription factor [Clostridia bacterium]